MYNAERNVINYSHFFVCLNIVWLSFRSLLIIWISSTQKWPKFDVKSVISCQVMIFYLNFVMRITSHVQTLILNITSLPPVSFASTESRLSRTPVY